MKIVVDTNVLLAALRHRGPSASVEVLRRCLTGQAQPLVGTALFLEYESVFARTEPFRGSVLSIQERTEVLDAFLSVCAWTKIYFGWRPNLPDEGDNHLLELAIAGGAEAVVTKNVRHFRVSELRFPLRILTPEQFIQEK